MTVHQPPNDLRELQRAIAHAAVDRMLAEQVSVPEPNSLNAQQKGEDRGNRGRAMHIATCPEVAAKAAGADHDQTTSEVS